MKKLKYLRCLFSNYIPKNIRKKVVVFSICILRKLKKKFKVLALYFFNRDLNRGCLVYMFSLRFSGSKLLINLRRQFRVRKFSRVLKLKFFIHNFLRDLKSFCV